MKILLTAIGKRVQLIKYLKKNCTVVGADAGELSPASKFVDKFYKIPKCNEEGYIGALLNICKVESIKFLIPLYELEFEILCENRHKFNQMGTILLLSHENIINICQDKLNTYKFFVENRIKTAITYSKKEVKELLESGGQINFPLIIKPVNGMGSSDVFKVNDLRELEFFIDYIKNPIIQEFLEGTEYTIDVFCDLIGNIISIVPRERIEIRSGEVSKSKTVRHKEVIKETYKLIDKLSRYGGSDISVIGPFTIQCKENSNGEIKFIEINPRFGGGVPLTFEAGVDYSMYFKLMSEGKNLNNIIGQFQEITMIRYDEAIFL